MVGGHGLEVRSKEKGAAIIGLIIALLSVGILFFAGKAGFGPTKWLKKQTETGADFSRVNKALALFVARNYRLPCPANGALATGHANDGVEAGSPGSCTYITTQGVLPWKALGLSPKDAVDPWGGRLGYAPTSAATATDAFKTAAPADGISVSGTSYVYVVISYGPNGAGAMQPSGQRKTAPSAASAEYPNADANGASFANLPYNDGRTNSNNYFDDILTMKTAAQLCTAAGSGYCTAPSEELYSLKDNPSDFVSTDTSNARVVRSSTGGTAVAGQSNTLNFSSRPGVSDSSSLDSLGNDTSTCVWLNKEFDFQSKSLRAYFKFNIFPGDSDNTAYGDGDGFTFILTEWGTPMAACGHTGSSLGYHMGDLGGGRRRMAIEFDTYRYSEGNQQTDDRDGNHVAALFNNSIDHGGSNPHWAAPCSVRSTYGSSSGCTWRTSGSQPKTWLEERSRVSPTRNPYPVRIEIQQGCNSTCSTCGSTGSYVQVRAWIDCTHASCSTLTGASPRAALDAATQYTLNYCTAKPTNWSSQMDSIMVGFGAATGGAVQSIAITDLQVGTVD